MVHWHKAEKAGLHWDLRLEYDGVLKSWAIPKGMPTKGERHLAIKVEDHSLAYGKWEGEITEGYGKGIVKIDTSGHYETIEKNNKTWKFKILSGKYKGTWRLTYWKDNKWLITKSADLKYDGYSYTKKKSEDNTQIVAQSSDNSMPYFLGAETADEERCHLCGIVGPVVVVDVKGSQRYFCGPICHNKYIYRGSGIKFKAEDDDEPTTRYNQNEEEFLMDALYRSISLSEEAAHYPLNYLNWWFELGDMDYGGHPRNMLEKPWKWEEEMTRWLFESGTVFDGHEDELQDLGIDPIYWPYITLEEMRDKYDWMPDTDNYYRAEDEEMPDAVRQWLIDNNKVAVDETEIEENYENADEMYQQLFREQEEQERERTIAEQLAKQPPQRVPAGRVKDWHHRANQNALSRAVWRKPSYSWPPQSENNNLEYRHIGGFSKSGQSYEDIEFRMGRFNEWGALVGYDTPYAPIRVRTSLYRSSPKTRCTRMDCPQNGIIQKGQLITWQGQGTQRHLTCWPKPMQVIVDEILARRETPIQSAEEFNSENITESQFRDYARNNPTVANSVDSDDGKFLLSGVMVGAVGAILVGTLSTIFGNIYSEYFLDKRKKNGGDYE